MGVDRLGNPAQTFCSCGGDQLNLARFTFGFVDLALLVCFGQVDGFLLLTFGHVDLGFTFTLGLGDHRATFPLGAHLLLQRIKDGRGQLDVGDLVTQYLHTPRLGSLIQRLHHLHVDGFTLLEGLVQIDLADHRTQGGLRQLHGRVAVIVDAIAGQFRVNHLQVKHAIDHHLDVVAGNTGLAGHVDRLFLQGVLVGHTINKGDQDVKTGVQCFRILAQTFDDKGRALRHDTRGLGQGNNDQRQKAKG